MFKIVLAIYLVFLSISIVMVYGTLKHVEQMLQDGTDACGEVSK